MPGEGRPPPRRPDVPGPQYGQDIIVAAGPAEELEVQVTDVHAAAGPGDGEAV